MRTAHEDRAPHLNSVTLHNIHPFGSEAQFRFDPRVNVLIGPNGAGKSAALDGFAREWRRRISPSANEPEPSVERVMEPEGASFEDVTTVYVGPTRAPLTSDMVLSDLQQLDVQGRVTAFLALMRRGAWVAFILGLAFLTVMVIGNVFSDPEAQWIKSGMDGLLVAYLLFFPTCIVYLGASLVRRNPLLLNFLLGNRLLANVLTYRSQVSPIFMFQAVLAANRRWVDLERESNDDELSRAARDAANLALKCAKEIAPEVFPASASLKTGTIQTVVRSLLLGRRQRRSFTDHFSTVDTRYSPAPLHITNLSAGTQNTLLIAWYLGLSLAYSNEFREGWEDLPAILFIDEIENHLHPAWQRRFIPVFLEHFPNLQVIATTHSPFPIAGLKAGQVHKLCQDSDRITRVKANEFDIIGWTADEILHEYLDVQDPTDLETAQAVEVLRWLDSLESLAEEDSAESWRAAVVEELSALIGDDELPPEDVLIKRWLTGVIESPVAVAPPLEGEAEAWRVSVIGQFRSLVGVDILSGGPAARQRQAWTEQMASGTFPRQEVVLDNEQARG